MPKAYQPQYKPRPDAPGFWRDAWLTNHGCFVVDGGTKDTAQGGRLYALAWGPNPVDVLDLPSVTNWREHGAPVGHSKPGWYGPLPVPPNRRYEYRQQKRQHGF